MRGLEPNHPDLRWIRFLAIFWGVVVIIGALLWVGKADSDMAYEQDGKEVYRGEYQETGMKAYCKAQKWLMTQEQAA